VTADRDTSAVNAADIKIIRDAPPAVIADQARKLFGPPSPSLELRDFRVDVVGSDVFVRCEGTQWLGEPGARRALAMQISLKLAEGALHAFAAGVAAATAG
jgi:hypothetical protein